MENNPMNQDVFAGQWKQMRGELKSWWGKLADDDFDRIGGQKDKLIGVVQEKYGYAREKAQQEVERRFKEYGDKMSGSDNSGRQDTAAAVAGGPANAPNEGPIATTVAAVADGVEVGARRDFHGSDRRGGWVGIGTRRDFHGGNRRSGWSGIGELVSPREKIRRDGNRHHRLDTPVPRPIVIGWRGPWLYPGPTYPEVNLWITGLPGLQRRAWRRCLAAS